MSKKLLAILLAMLFCLALFSACGQQPATDQPEENQTQGDPQTAQPSDTKTTFIVGLDENFPPMGFRDDKGEIVGFDVDMAKEAAKRMGLEPVFQPIDWDSKELELNSGKIDCIWNGLTITPERQEAMAFTKPYLKNTQSVAVLNDSTFKTLEDLKGQVVGTQSGSSAYELIENTPDLKATFKSVEVYPDYESALLDMKSGRISAVLGDMILLRYKMSVQTDQYRLLDDVLADEEYGVGLRKDDTELLTKLQTAIDEMNADGTSAQISQKWFGADVVLK